MELNLDVKLIFSLLNGKVTTAIHQKLQEDFSHSGLDITPEVWTVLLCLDGEGSMTQLELCNETLMGKSLISRLLDRMEKAGLVRREVNAADRRSNIIRLTGQGHLLKLKAQKVANRTLRDALRGLGHESLIITQDVLRQILANIVESQKE